MLLEDDAVIGMLLEDMVETLGCIVEGSFQALEPAMEALQSRESDFDAAVLDVNLNGQSSFPLADLLDQRGIPYLFSSGYKDSLGRNAPRLNKPFSLEELRIALDKL